MKIIKTETIFKGKYLMLKITHFINKNGKKEFWEFVERKDFGPPVVIFALTKNKEVLLEKIYRVPFKDWVIELPAGLQDKKGEREEEVARRELLEETGYKAERIIPIIKGPISPGGFAQKVVYYFAKDVTFVKKPVLEDSEEIEVIKVPIKKLVDFVERESKKMKVDLKILTILPILEKRKLI